MTTINQDQWAQFLEGATQREIRQMAEYAIDHLQSEQEKQTLLEYIEESVS